MAARLAVAREEYAKLGAWIAATEALVGEPPAENDGAEGDQLRPAPRHRHPGAQRVVGKDDFVGMTTSQAVKAFLEFMGKGSPQGPRDMARALVAGGRDQDEQKAYQNVTSVLKRMNKSGEVKQVRRGQWGLASWYGSSGPKKGE